MTTNAATNAARGCSHLPGFHGVSMDPRGLVGAPGPAVRRSPPVWSFIAGPPLLPAQARAIVSGHQAGSQARPATSSFGCANRSCGPPKLGRLLFNGVRRCHRSTGGPCIGSQRASREPVEPPWGPACVFTSSRAPLGPVVPKQTSNRNPTEPDFSRYGPMAPDEP